VTIVTGDVDLERDRHLVGRCQAGDADAFGELYALYHQRLVRHCAQRLGGHTLAEDVAQEAFIRAWRAMDRFEVHRAFYPWLQVIASNACTDVLRRHRPTAPLSEFVDAAVFDDGRGVEEQLTMAFDAILANGAMEQLSERHRRVLHLREQLDWSVQQIAEHEGLEANAVDTLLWRARVSLRRRFRALSEGAAAIIGTGGTRYVSARNRLAHVVSGVDGAGVSTPRVRAAVAAVVVLGVGASSTPLILSPAAPTKSVPGVQHASPVTTVSPGRGLAPVAAGRGGAPTAAANGAVPPSSTSSNSSAGLPVVNSGAGTGTQNQATASGVVGGQPSGDAGGVPAAAPSGTAGVQTLTGTVNRVTGTVSGVATTVGGSVAGTVGTVLTVTGGVVQSAPAIPTLPPILQPITGGSAVAKVGRPKGTTGVASSLLGLDGN